MKDKESKLYSQLAYFASNVLYMIPFLCSFATVHLIILFYTMNINNEELVNLAWFLIFNVCITYIGGIFTGILIGLLVDNFTDSKAMEGIVAIPFFIVSGIFQNAKEMLLPLKLFSFLSIPKIGFQGLYLNEMRDSEVYLQNCHLPP